MNEIAQWLGYGVMVIGGAFLVLFGFYLVWSAFCGAAIGTVRSLRAIRAALRVIKSARSGVKP